MQIRRVIRTPGTVADEDELDRMRRYLLGGLESAQRLRAGRRAVRGDRRAVRVPAFSRRRRDHGRRSAKAASRKSKKTQEHEVAATATKPDARRRPARRLKPPPGGAAVRMYRIGHGDCFLIAFAGESPSKPAYVLIDCGYKPGSPGKLAQPTKAKEIGTHIIATTGGFVDVAHRHPRAPGPRQRPDVRQLPRPQGRQGLVRLDRKSRRTISPISCARSSRTDCSG